MMSTPNLPTIIIYSDGACKPNPGPGGWAAVLLFPNQKPTELVGSEPATTSNQMELKAALEALQNLSTPHRVQFYTDSKYLKQGITEWLPLWEERNWQTTGKTDVKNQNFWQPLSVQLERHHITWHWVKGHAGDKWNERVDYLAHSAVPKPKLPLGDTEAIHIFTAASYLGNQKKGGWAALLRYRVAEKVLSGTVPDTSSNRMHLQAAIEGLKAIKKPFPIHLYTTSGYLKDGATAWVKNWQARHWQTKEGKSVSHRDLWEELAGLTRKYKISWHIISKSDLPPEMVQVKDLATTAARSN